MVSAQPLLAEAHAASAPQGHKASGAAGKERLRLWLRLLRATRLIEGELRERLRRDFSTTLPRFDVLAALSRAPEGMAMGDLSRVLLVSNGNVTGIVERLCADRLVARTAREGDRRAFIVTLTPEGRALFAQMAVAHEGWVDELLAGIGESDARALSAMLKAFRTDRGQD